MVSAVIWDNDDLLVNSFPLVVKTYETFLKLRNLNFTDLPKSIIDRMPGRKSSELLTDIANYFAIKEDMVLMRAERKAIFMALVERELELMPGAKNLLVELQRTNLRMAMASSGSGSYINVVLNKFELRSYFEIVVTGDEVEKGKPDPQIFNLAVSKLHLVSQDCVVLEDATNGVEAAKAAGCKCVGVRNPHTPVQDLKLADLIVDSLADLNVEVINNLKS